MAWLLLNKSHSQLRKEVQQKVLPLKLKSIKKYVYLTPAKVTKRGGLITLKVLVVDHATNVDSKSVRIAEQDYVIVVYPKQYLQFASRLKLFEPAV